jgi:AmiR/NasT family two-component response regulator
MTSPTLTHDEQVVIWQAQGVLMESFGCELAEAALLLRQRALSERRSVADTASGVVSGVVQLGDDHL